MADIRSLLRAERANRRITHPNASYTSDGKLLCNLCETTVKSEAAWGAHLHSTQHTLRLSRARDVSEARTPVGNKRKRKLESVSDSPEDERKRVRGGEELKEEVVEGEGEAIVEDVPETSGGEEKVEVVVEENGEDDEAGMAAFLADIERTSKGIDVRNVSSGATISAAPMSAEEIAAKAREEQSSQRGRRDDELLAEKEDAERLIEEEMEEMEGLEERVRKLKEKREALRTASTTETNGGGEAQEGQVEEKDEGDDSDDDDDFDDWHFGSA